MRRGAALIFLHLGLALAAVALSAWLVRRTALEPERTTRVADAVLQSPQLRTEISSQVSDRMAQATGTPAFQIEPGVDGLLGDDGVVDSLATTVAAAHLRLIDRDAPPATIDTSAMSTLSGGVVPEAYTLDVPTLTPLDAARRFIDRWLPTVAVMAAGLVLAGVALHPNHPRALVQVGYWLVATTLLQVVVGWIVPVIVVPAVLSSPWADVFATVVEAYSSTLIGTIASVLAAGGVALVLGATWGLRGWHDYDA